MESERGLHPWTARSAGMQLPYLKCSSHSFHKTCLLLLSTAFQAVAYLSEPSVVAVGADAEVAWHIPVVLLERRWPTAAARGGRGTEPRVWSITPRTDRSSAPPAPPGPCAPLCSKPVAGFGPPPDHPAGSPSWPRREHSRREVRCSVRRREPVQPFREPLDRQEVTGAGEGGSGVGFCSLWRGRSRRGFANGTGRHWSRGCSRSSLWRLGSVWSFGGCV